MGSVFSDLANGGAQSAPARRRAHKHLYLVFGAPQIRFIGTTRAPLLYHVVVPTVETDSVEAVGGVRCSAAISSRAGVAPVLLPAAEAGSSNGRAAASPPVQPSLDSAMAAVSAVAAAAVDSLTGGAMDPTTTPTQQRMRRVLRGGGAARGPAVHRSGSTPTDEDDDNNGAAAQSAAAASPSEPTTGGSSSSGAAPRRMRFVVDLDDIDAQSGAVRVDVFVRACVRYIPGSGVAIESMDSRTTADSEGRKTSGGVADELYPYHVLSTSLHDGRCSTTVETEAFAPAALLLPARGSSNGVANQNNATAPQVPSKASPFGLTDGSRTRATGGATTAPRSPGPAGAAGRPSKRPAAPSGFVLVAEGPARGLPSQAHIVVRIMYSVPADAADAGGRAPPTDRSPLTATEPTAMPGAEAATAPSSEAPSVLAMTIGSQAGAAVVAAAATRSTSGKPLDDIVTNTTPGEIAAPSNAVASACPAPADAPPPILHQLFYFYELPPSATTAADAAPVALKAHPARLLQVGTGELYRLESIFDLGGDAGVQAPAAATPGSALASPTHGAADPAHHPSDGDGHSDHDGVSAGEGGKPLSGSPSAAIEAGDDGSDDCVVCLSAAKDTLILPCRHLCLCADCAPLLRQQSNKCPVCRGAIERIVCIR